MHQETKTHLESKRPAIEMARKKSNAEAMKEHVVTIGSTVGRKGTVVRKKTISSPQELKDRTTKCCFLTLITMTAYDAFDTATDIHFTIIMFSEGYNMWGLIMSIASLFGLFNFLCSLPCFKYCFDRKDLLVDNAFLPYHYHSRNPRTGNAEIGTFTTNQEGKLTHDDRNSKLPGKVLSTNKRIPVNRTTSPVDGAPTNRLHEFFYMGLSRTRADDLMMYLFVFKLPEDIPAAIIRIFYLYEKAEFISWGDKACDFSCKMTKLGTFTNILGIVLGVLVCLYFCGVMINVIRSFPCCTEVVFPFLCYFLGIATLSVMACFFLGFVAISPPSFALTPAAVKALWVLIFLIIPVSFCFMYAFLRSSLKLRRPDQDVVDLFE